MATQVRHGSNPQFTVKTSGKFRCVIEGYYTDQGVYIRRDPRRSRRFFLWRWFDACRAAVVEEAEPATEGLGAGGVTEVQWHSERPEKRVAELLVLRTCFRSFYEQTMKQLGHDPNGAYRL